VAKKATVIAVKVFPDNAGSTDTASIIKGMEWAIKDAQTNGNINKSVMNLSLGGGQSQIMDQAVDIAVQAGMVVVVAAGNSGVSHIMLPSIHLPSLRSLLYDIIWLNHY
jgi:subtilisin family serine protease